MTAKSAISQSARRTSYDVVMVDDPKTSSSRRSSRQSSTRQRQIVPDGIVAHRNAVRKRGGLVAIALALAVLVVGLFLLILPGSLTGALGFIFTFIALPTMPLFGIPATGGFSRYGLSFISSLLLWWIIGHYASLRAVRAVIASWPEWRREFRPLALGLILGSIISLALAAIMLGVL